MEQTAQSSGFFLMLIFAVVFMGLMFVQARSQKKRERELAQKINSVQKGDRIIISGGIVGTVAGFKDNLLEVKIAENVKINILKTAVVGLVTDLQAAANEGGVK